MNTQKAALNPLVSGRSVSFEIVEEIKDQIYSNHCSKQTIKLSQLQYKKFELTYNYTFLAIYLLNRR